MRNGIFSLCALVLLVQGCAGPQQSNPDAGGSPGSVMEERLRNATVKTHKTKSGSTFTEVRFAGSLAPNFDLDCVDISDVSNKMNPPSMVYAAKKCILDEKYTKAWALLTTAMGYAYYDISQLADRSTRGARSVLVMRALSDVPDEKRQMAMKVSMQLEKDPEQVGAYCAQLKRIGPPTYEPMWAIKHGIGAYKEPRDGHYLLDVDTDALWAEVLKNRCIPKT